MSSDIFHADSYFVELCSEFLNQEIERYYSVPKKGVVALLVDHSKSGTYVNNKQSLLPNSRTGLKNGEKIGISYLHKDMKKEQYAAFKFSIINSLISENQSFPTLIDLSSKSIQKNEKTATYVTFIPDEKVDHLTYSNVSIKRPGRPPILRSYCTFN